MSIGPPAARDQRYSDREAAALAERAFCRNLSTHQFAELLAECQTQSGSAVFAGAGIVRHGEFFEKMSDLIRRNSDAGVDDVNHELVAIFEQDTIGNELDLAVLGEFGGVIQQLARHVLE